MKPPDTLTAHVKCPRCLQPIALTVPVEFACRGATVYVSTDGEALQRAITAHVKQHEQ